MFDKIIALFERLVIAHERLAESQEALLQNCVCGSTDLVDEIKEAVSSPAVETDWNPFTSALMNKYVADKQAVLDARLQEHGIEVKAGATGREKHQALLDWANAKKDELADALAEAAQEEHVTPKVVEPEVKEVSHEEMKTAVKTYAAKHGREKAKALILEVGGAETLAEISDPDKVRALYLAAKEV